MPRVKPKPKFAGDELVTSFDSFAGTLPDGTPIVVNPSDVLRGDDPVVLAYPSMFGPEGDQQARAAYWDAAHAEQVALRARARAEEAERAAEQRKRVEALAD
jgi:hypothetical protein